MTIAAIIAAIGGILAALFAAFSVGKAKANAKATEQRSADKEALGARIIEETKAASQREVKTVQGANDELSKVNAMSADDLANELRDNWTRPDDSAGTKR